MSTTNSHAQLGSVEMIAEWQGPAIAAPGVVFGDKQVEQLAETADVAELVAWIAVTGLSGASGNAAHQAARTKVLAVLSSWRRRFGQGKIDEVKQRLLDEMQKYKGQRKITEDELRQRMDVLFNEIEG